MAGHPAMIAGHHVDLGGEAGPVVFAALDVRDRQSRVLKGASKAALKSYYDAITCTRTRDHPSKRKRSRWLAFEKGDLSGDTPHNTTHPCEFPVSEFYPTGRFHNLRKSAGGAGVREVAAMQLPQGGRFSFRPSLMVLFLERVVGNTI